MHVQEPKRILFHKGDPNPASAEILQAEGSFLPIAERTLPRLCGVSDGQKRVIWIPNLNAVVVVFRKLTRVIADAICPVQHSRIKEKWHCHVLINHVPSGTALLQRSRKLAGERNCPPFRSRRINDARIRHKTSVTRIFGVPAQQTSGLKIAIHDQFGNSIRPRKLQIIS